ncbi:ribosome silencing factor [Specibacter sp. NPDC078709]|uniref:ribosome silencing factor n=1 Tax=unclassified Specibacter TaxID=3081321 RepID=UPI00342E2F67
MTATQQSIDLARAAARAASDKLAQDVIAIDVSERLAITDIFFIASAPTERQVNAIVDGIEDELHKFDLRPVRREGRSGGRWVLLDYADIVVHVQHEEDRVFYALERLYGDCPVIDLQLAESDPSANSAELLGSAKATKSTDSDDAAVPATPAAE